jgi:hypothetical protein
MSFHAAATLRFQLMRFKAYECTAQAGSADCAVYRTAKTRGAETAKSMRRGALDPTPRKRLDIALKKLPAAVRQSRRGCKRGEWSGRADPAARIDCTSD